MNRYSFPGAPHDAEISEEGWLIVGDEAWTVREWALMTPMQRRQVTGDAPAWDEGPEDEHRRKQRERTRRRRAAA